MGLIGLALAYLALAAVLAGVALALLRRLLGTTVSWPMVALLASLPLAYTGAGFVPHQTLSPTPMIAGVPPWSNPDLVKAVRESSSPRNPLLLDAVSQFLPWREAARSDLLLNPAQGSGAALLANGQSAVFFPTEALARLLPPFRAVTFSQAARLLLAVWGIFLLARILGASEPAALVAATVWIGSGFLQLWRLHPHTLVAAIAPWILLAMVVLVRCPGPRPAVGLAAAGALAFAGGHPETLLHVLLFGLVFSVLVLFWDPVATGARGDALSRVPAIAGWGSVAGLLSALLSAPLLFPFVENLLVSSEWRYRAHAGTLVEAPFPAALLRLKVNLALRALGHPIDGSWVGPRNLAEVGGGAIGAAGILLALLAVAGARRRRWAASLLTLGLVGLVVSIHLPLVSRPFGWIPLLRSTLLGRLSLWWVLAAALLAAVSVDAWRESTLGERAAARRAWRPAVVVVGLILGVALAWAAGAPWAVHPAIAVAGWGSLATAALLLALPYRPLVWAALVVVLLVPRVGQLADWVPTASRQSFYVPTPAIEWLQDRLEEPPAGGRVAGLHGALVPHSASFFGLEEIRANDPMTYAPYEDFLLLLGPRPHTGWHTIRDPAHPVLTFLGVRYVVAHPERSRHRNAPVAYEGTDARIYAVPDPLPRLFVPRRVTVPPRGSTALEETRRIEDFAERAIVSGGGFPTEEGAHDNGAARIEEIAVDRRRISAMVEAEEPAVVATSQPALPGWRVAIDGAETEALTINGAFLGAEVDRGRHRIELVYAPASWRAGLLAAFVGMVSGLLLWVRSPAAAGLRR